MREPSYLALHRTGELRRRVDAAYRSLAECRLCPRECGVNRLAGEIGFCRSTAKLRIASWNLHHWEEPPISGTRGSGTIFFSGCTGRCSFCQNYPISQMDVGQSVEIERLAEMMLELQGRGADNINLVTPTHFVAQFLCALDVAAGKGLRLPIVYNCSGFESVTMLRLLDQIVDIYLPDAKYADDTVAQRLSSFPDYLAVNRAALREIHRQVGDELVLDDACLLQRGMIIRHMVLPANLAGSSELFAWIATHLSPDVHFSLMNQYFPAYQAFDDPDLQRKVTEEEYDTALEAFFDAGLHAGWNQNCELDEG